MTSLRTWATPLTAGSFLVMGVSGVLLFFHLDSGLNQFIHEWAGWVLLAGVAAHLVLNWRPFKTYFKRPAALALMAAGVVALAVSFWPVAESGSPVGAVFRAIDAADVDTVIALSGRDIQTGLALLSEAGFNAAPDMPMTALTGGDRGVRMQVLGALFP